MGKDECAEFRNVFDDLTAGKLSEAEQQRWRSHADKCKECDEWQKRTGDMLSAIGAMPQFDVPELVTQRILTAVDAERNRSTFGAHDLLLPLGLVSMAALFTIMPIDSIDGVLSTTVSAAALALLYLAIRLAKTEEAAA